MAEHVATPLCEEAKKLGAEFKGCQKLLTAVGDENRQHLLCAMLGCPLDGVRVAELTTMTHLSRPAVSHHMQILKNAGLVKARKEGTLIYYYLDPDENQIALLASLVRRMTKVMAQLPDRDER